MLLGGVKPKSADTSVGRRETARQATAHETYAEPLKNIRCGAFGEYGGVIYTNRVPEGFVPECITRFDRMHGVIIQSFGTKVEVKINRRDSSAAIYVDGDERERFERVTTAGWNRVLYRAQRIYDLYKR